MTITNNSKMLQMMQVLAYEKDIPLEGLFKTLEAAIAVVISKRMHCNIRIEIDNRTGNQTIFKRREVIDDDNLDKFNTKKNIKLSEALRLDEDLKEGDFIEEILDTVNIDLGRVTAQAVKQVLLKKVKESERIKAAAFYKNKLHSIINGVVKRIIKQGLIIDVGYDVEALIRRSDLIPRESYRIGDRIRAYLQEINLDNKDYILILSRTCNEMLTSLFALEVPEINEEIIQIKAVARDQGFRSKIAVKTNDGRIDPIGACIGMRGMRINAVVQELKNERIDVILWDNDPAKFVINAISPAKVSSISIDEEKRIINIAVLEEQLAIAIGRGGQNIKLANKLLPKWHLNVMTEKAFNELNTNQTEYYVKLFSENLDVDHDLSLMLIDEGFTSLEEIAYIAKSELLNIEGFEIELVTELQNRAKEAVAKQEKIANNTLQDNLQDITELDNNLIEILEKNNIDNMEKLAECSVDELLDIIDIDKELAAKLIMRAREPWFK